jgi:pilus assembly protein Flp/PilA
MIKALMAFYRFLWRKDQGAAMAEYGLLLLLIAVAVIAGATALGTAINSLYNTVAGDF